MIHYSILKVKIPKDIVDKLNSYVDEIIVNKKKSVTLNHAELLSQAKEEQEQLKTSLIEMLASTEYLELSKRESEMVESTATTFKNSPLPIFVG